MLLSRLRPFARVSARCVSGTPSPSAPSGPSSPLQHGPSVPHVQTTRDELDNKGTASFIRRVYATTGLGVCATLGTAQLVSMSQLSESMYVSALAGGTAVALGSVLVIPFVKSTVEKDDEGHLVSRQPPIRWLAYGALSLGSGLMISPLVQICNSVSPAIFPTAIGLSVTTMLGAGLYAYSRPHGALSLWGAPLFGTLTGFCALSVCSLASTWIVGPNLFSAIWLNVDLYGGLALFAGLTAYDTYVAVERYREGDPDHIGCAVDFLLDFVNLLVRFMQIYLKKND